MNTVTADAVRVIAAENFAREFARRYTRFNSFMKCLNVSYTRIVNIIFCGYLNDLAFEITDVEQDIAEAAENIMMRLFDDIQEFVSLDNYNNMPISGDIKEYIFSRPVFEKTTKVDMDLPYALFKTEVLTLGLKLFQAHVMANANKLRNVLWEYIDSLPVDTSHLKMLSNNKWNKFTDRIACWQENNIVKLNCLQTMIVDAHERTTNVRTC